ncbi:MAG: hypothetical protein AB1461_18975 [Thermodesulfobacteriota bacterium]
MRRAAGPLFSLLFAVTLSACAAALIPATSDPQKKIGYAYMLFDEQQRPLPAERLIREAIEAYKQQNDELGLAEGYRAYGFFFRSPAIEKWRKIYEEHGFLDKSATYFNRYDESIEYFEHSARLFEKNDKYDSLTNIYLNMGFTYEFAKKNDKACEAYRTSLVASSKFKESNPSTSITLPKGFVGTYEDYINGLLKRLECK